MSEKCPLGSGLYWDGGIPDICSENCEALWDNAKDNLAPEIDNFSKDRISGVEFGGESLQRYGATSGRSFSILSSLISTGEDAFSESWDFTCPND